MSTSSADDGELMALINPVWANTFWVKNALELYEGVTQHADKLGGQHGHFFGLVQQYTLEAAVLGLCKLFDRTNSRYEKDTVPSLFNHIKAELTETYVCRLDATILTHLGIDRDVANKIAIDFFRGKNFIDNKSILLDCIENLLTEIEKSTSLGKLRLVRDKGVAHQERVCDDVKEKMKYLPSLDEMEKLNNWATDFCRFIACAMSNTTLGSSGPSARIAALHIVAKILGKDFDRGSYQESEDFFRRQ
jgi:hypothetical protein